MNSVAKSMLYSGIYLILIGVALLVIPGMFAFPGFPIARWLQAIGIMLGLLGYFCIATARNGDRAEIARFFRWTFPIRFSMFVLLIVFGVIGLVNPIIIIFGFIDFLAAIWTVIGLWLSRSSVTKSQ